MKSHLGKFLYQFIGIKGCLPLPMHHLEGFLGIIS